MIYPIDVVTEMRRRGYVMLPGLTGFIEDLNPLTHPQAWNFLADPAWRRVLFDDPACRDRFWMLDDDARINRCPQAAVDFVTKDNKSHLTVLSGTDSFLQSSKLPEPLACYFAKILGFIHAVRTYLGEILPAPGLPTLLKFRAFHYHHSDLLAGLRHVDARGWGMRPHVDPSIVTLIIAQSDGLLRLWHRREWKVAARSGGEPFALLIPGLAAMHDLALSPTPHLVEINGEQRMSLTLFLTPDLGHGAVEEANKRLGRWRLTTKRLVQPHAGRRESVAGRSGVRAR